MATIHDVWAPAHRILRNARQMINQALRPLGITSAEGNILLHLMMQQGPVHQEQVAEDLGIGKAAISRAVDSLERKGYLLRARDAGDKRRWRLDVTDKARSCMADVQEAYDAVYRRAQQALPGADFAQLVAMMDVIAAAFAQGEA